MKIIITLILSLALLLWISFHVKAADPHSTMQRDFPTTRFYKPDGASAGSATTYGNQTKFYGPNGALLGTITTNSGRTTNGRNSK